MILNLYKPKGISSFNFINRVKRKMGFSKIGHAGTLDPLAEGVLVVLTDKDCKRQNDFMKQDKVYEAEILLGAFSESFDREKPLIFSEKAPKITESQLVEVLSSMHGQLTLPAPLYSAKIIAGKRLYKYANQGIVDIELPQVTSQIDSIKLINFSSLEYQNQQFPLIVLEIRCSSGTYIRSIANYLGERLNTKGVLHSLKRTQVGEFLVQDSQVVELD